MPDDRDLSYDLVQVTVCQLPVKSPSMHVMLILHSSMKRSAHVQVTEAQRRMIDWVQDADLWAWRLVDSRAFHSGFP